jgi:hypothetical protein
LDTGTLASGQTSPRHDKLILTGTASWTTEGLGDSTEALSPSNPEVPKPQTWGVLHSELIPTPPATRVQDYPSIFSNPAEAGKAPEHGLDEIKNQGGSGMANFHSGIFSRLKPFWTGWGTTGAGAARRTSSPDPSHGSGSLSVERSTNSVSRYVFARTGTCVHAPMHGWWCLCGVEGGWLV